MTTFHEQIRLILTDVDKFCTDGLHGVKLSKKLTQDKEKILKGLNDLYEEYPNLRPETKNKIKSKDDRDVSDGSVKTNSSGHNEEDETADNYADIAFKDLENPVKCGYLEKKRKKEMALFKGSQKRYCVVHKNIFYYYEKPTDKKQCGAFSLIGYVFQPAPDKVKEASKKDLCFELIAPNKRCYEFIADSKEDFDSWKEAIKKAAQEGSTQDEMGECDEIYEAIEDNFGSDLPPPITSRRPPSGDPAEYLAPKTHKPLPPTPIPDDEPLPLPPPPITEEIYEDAESSSNQTEPTSLPPPPVPPSRNATPSKPSIAPPSPPPSRKSPMADRKPPAMPLPPTPTLPPKKKIEWPAEDFENMFYGKWDCTGGADDELSFKRGDVIHVINFDFDKDHWWVGELMGKFGLVPKDHLARAFELVEV